MNLPYQPPNAQLKGEKFVQKLAKTAHEAGFGWHIVSLAWSAGPVTFLALAAGSYLAFGQPPKTQTFFYFASYTLVAGMIAVVVSFVRRRIIQPRIEKANQQILEVVDQLFHCYFAVRDYYVREYEPSEQAKIATLWALSSASTDVDALQEAIRDLTGDETLARGIKRIELYRRNGFSHLVQQECERYADKMRKHHQALAESLPIISRYFEERFQGIAPTSRRGQLRNSGFLARILEAADADSPEWLSSEDVLATYILTLELVLGRSVLILHPHFVDAPKLDEAKERMDSALSDFRLQRRKRNSNLRLLARQLQMLDGVEPQPLMGMDAVELLEHIKTLAKRVDIRQQKHLHLRRRYQLAYEANQKMQRYFRLLQQSEKAYNRQWDKTRFTEDTTVLKEAETTDNGVVLQLKEQYIELTTRQKYEVVELLQEQLHELAAEPEFHMGQYQQFAIECINVLDEVLNITEPEEQLAIEESRQADFGCIEPGLTAQTKLNWGRIMVEEVEETRTATVHRLAEKLVRFYNVPMTPQTIEYLKNEYGATEQYLHQLGEQSPEYPIIASAQLENTLHSLPSWQSLIK